MASTSGTLGRKLSLVTVPILLGSLSSVALSLRSTPHLSTRTRVVNTCLGKVTLRYPENSPELGEALSIELEMRKTRGTSPKCTLNLTMDRKKALLEAKEREAKREDEVKAKAKAKGKSKAKAKR